MDLITDAALERLNMKPGKVPWNPQSLESAVIRLNPPEEWTWDHVAAYRHLRGVVRSAWLERKRADCP